MRFLSALAVFGLALSSAAAQAQNYYWCDPYHAWYPSVATCPAPWQGVLVKPQSSQPEVPQRATGPQMIPEEFRSFQMLGDGLDEWCKTVKLPSSIAMCSDPELRSLAIERQRVFNEVRWGLEPQR